MCRICDGFSLDDVLADDAARIAEHGFVLIGVEDPEAREDHPPWAYTVGLLDAADHPEMIIAGVSSETSSSLNQIQYKLDTFNMWHQLQRYGAVETSELQGVQIILPSTLFCSEHGESQPRLDNPDVRVDVPRLRPNRAQRRRHRPRRRAS